MPAVRSLWLASFVVVCACGPLSPPKPDAGERDAGVDGGAADAGLDAGAPDAGVDAGSEPDAGMCGGALCPPEQLTGERIDPWDLTVDDTSIYWLEYGLNTSGLDGQLMRQSKDVVCLQRDAGCAEDLNQDVYGRFRVDTLTKAGDELCWTEDYPNARNVICQSVITNAERTVAKQQAYATKPTSANGALFWVNQGSSTVATGQVMRLSLTAPAGTAPQVVADHRPSPTSVAVANGVALWAELGNAPDAGAVWAQPLDGGAAVALASGLSAPWSLVPCGDAVVWVDYVDGTVLRASLGAPGATTLVPGQAHPVQVVCDATHVYWLNAGNSANGADGALWQAQLDGGAVQVMRQAIPIAWALAQDDAYVYWIAQGTVTRLNGAIWRMRKHP